MLNDTYLIGTQIVRFDAKNRIILPRFSNCEPKEEILVLSDEEKFRIYSFIYYQKLLERIEQGLLSVTCEEDFKKLDDLRQKIYSKILFKACLDNQRRFAFPLDVVQLQSKNCEVRGMGNYLQLRRL